MPRGAIYTVAVALERGSKDRKDGARDERRSARGASCRDRTVVADRYLDRYLEDPRQPLERRERAVERVQELGAVRHGVVLVHVHPHLASSSRSSSASRRVVRGASRHRRRHDERSASRRVVRGGRHIAARHAGGVVRVVVVATTRGRRGWGVEGRERENRSDARCSSEKRDKNARTAGAAAHACETAGNSVGAPHSMTKDEGGSAR